MAKGERAGDSGGVVGVRAGSGGVNHCAGEAPP